MELQERIYGFPAQKYPLFALRGYLKNNRISLVALKLLQTHTRENVIKIPFSLPMLKYTAYSLLSTGVNSLDLSSLNKGSISRNDG